jgi:hypothetical protein
MANRGHPHLREHLAAVIVLIRASVNWEQFKRMINRALPKYNTVLELPVCMSKNMKKKINLTFGQYL